MFYDICNADNSGAGLAELEIRDNSRPQAYLSRATRNVALERLGSKERNHGIRKNQESTDCESW